MVTVSDEDVAVGVSLTLLAGLVEGLQVVPGPDGVGTQVIMAWPAGRAAADAPSDRATRSATVPIRRPPAGWRPSPRHVPAWV